MKNFQAKGTGNSRLLKSSIPEGTTWAEALALLRAGTFPVDFAGFNPAGIQEQGTLLNKAALLQDRTAEALELPQEDPTIDDALYAVSQRESQPACVKVLTNGANITVTMKLGTKTLTGVSDANFIATLYPNKFGTWVMKAGSTTKNFVVDAIKTYETFIGIPALSSCSWTLINKVSNFGVADQVFHVGDTKSFTVNNVSYSAVIIGFNHDDLTGGNGKKAGITFQMVDCLATKYPMNSSNTNSGGWKNSAMRTSTMATLLNQLQSDLKSVIKAVDKRSTAGSQSTTIDTTSDKLFLLSEIEIFGALTHSKAGEGEQYAYYKAGNSRIKKVSGTADWWWERSPGGSSSTAFCRVASGGDAGYYAASDSGGVAFGFCI